MGSSCTSSSSNMSTTQSFDVVNSNRGECIVSRVWSRLIQSGKTWNVNTTEGARTVGLDTVSPVRTEERVGCHQRGSEDLLETTSILEGHQHEGSLEQDEVVRRIGVVHQHRGAVGPGT